MITAQPALAMRERNVGIACLLATALGWGLNWPILKALLAELPPLSARGWAGLAAMLALMLVARLMGERLRVPPGQWGRLMLASLLNVTGWMGFATVAMLWLGAGEAAIIAYSMPVWAALLAWPVLGETPTLRRVLALALGSTGVVVLLAAPGLHMGLARLPGAALVLAGAAMFALGTVLTKRAPLDMPPLALVAWQVGLGCLPILVCAILIEQPDFRHLSTGGWLAMIYMAAFPLCLCYLTWFAALSRLPAGAAAIGTLLTPVIGVVAATVVLHEPLGLREVSALALTVGGIVLAVRHPGD